MCSRDFSPPKDWREWFFQVTHALGVDRMMTVWDRHKGTIYGYGADMRNCAAIRVNPGEKLDETVELLNAIGSPLAGWPAHRLCDLTGHEATPKSISAIPDKRTWEEELLDDEGPWFNYRQACRYYRAGKCGPEMVKRFEDELIHELKQTSARVLAP